MDDATTNHAIDELAELFLTRISVDGRHDSAPTPDVPASPVVPSPHAPSVIAVGQPNPLAGPDPIRLDPKPNAGPVVASASGAVPPPPLGRPSDSPVIAEIGRPAPAPVDTETTTPRQSDPLRLVDSSGPAPTPFPSPTAKDPTPPLSPAPVALESPSPTFTANAPHPSPPGPETPTPATPAPHAPTGQAFAEAVLLGNLPGVSGPWLTQYAQLLADADGPVLILYAEPDTVEIELIEPSEQIVPPPPAVRVPPGDMDVMSLLQHLISAGPAPVRTVLLRCDALADSPDRRTLETLDDWTVLLGVDDAAVVGGYQTLKALTEALPEHPQRRIGLMFMGADVQSAEKAADKMLGAAEAYLSSQVELAGHNRRLAPANVRHLGKRTEPGLFDRLHTWLAGLRPPEEVSPQANPSPLPEALPEAVTPSAPERSAPEPVEQPEPQTPQAPTFPEPVAASTSSAPAVRSAKLPPRIWSTPPRVPSPTRSRPRRPAAASAPQPAVVVAESVTEPAPAAATAARTSPVSTPTLDTATARVSAATQASVLPLVRAQGERLRELPTPDLAEVLGAGPGRIEHGVTLDARCPAHPQTQLVLDEAGSLHLLRQAEPGTGQTGMRDAMLDLLDARSWTREHLALLRLTRRDRRFAEDVQPILHLFTERADLALPLTKRLSDPRLRIHLLQTLTLGGETGWFCTPLA